MRRRAGPTSGKSRWHLLDRATVFFGLISCLICALSANRSGLSWGVLWMFGSTSFTVVSCSILAFSLPLTYLLIRRHVALGRAPGLSELMRP